MAEITDLPQKEEPQPSREEKPSDDGKVPTKCVNHFCTSPDKTVYGIFTTGRNRKTWYVCKQCYNMHTHSFARQKILQKAALVRLPIDETAYAFLRGDFQLSKTFTVLKVDKIPPKTSPNTKEEINIGDIFPSESFEHIFGDLPSGKHLMRHKYPNQVRDVIPTENSESTVPQNPINTFENKQPHKSDHGRAMRRWTRHMEAKIQAWIPKAQHDPTMIPMPENVKFHIELLNNNPSIDSTLFASH
uniref:Uncharacterized protein n=1 Tax=Moniliophthora roreri TaxID=221103 RepID=A0A0W0FEL1_MONRR